MGSQRRRGYEVSHTISKEGLEFIASWEQFASDSYKDESGNLRIGYGHLLTAAELNSGLINQGKANAILWSAGVSKGQALSMLEHDLVTRVASINNKVKTQLEQNHFDALVSWSYSVGANYFNDSQLLKLLNLGKFHAIPYQMKLANKVEVDGKKVVSHRLNLRREAEVYLFVMADYGGE